MPNVWDNDALYTHYKVSTVSGRPLNISGIVVTSGTSTVTGTVTPNVQYGSGNVTSGTVRVTLASDGPGVANLASIAGLQIPPYDYISLSYSGSNLTGVVYRTGGATGSIVGNLSLSYSGSNLISVTKN